MGNAAKRGVKCARIGGFLRVFEPNSRDEIAGCSGAECVILRDDGSGLEGVAIRRRRRYHRGNAASVAQTATNLPALNPRPSAETLGPWP